MSHVVVSAVFHVKDGRADEAIAAFTDTVVSTHDEAGCLSYALHRDKNDPNVLVLVERWTSQVALEAHIQQPYVAALGAKAGDLLAAPPAIHICDPIPIGDPVKGTL
jgi:quinol monooxygenase YgiN